MSTALYQKYRPKTFGELVNQNHIKITLQNAIDQNKVGHAYLFYGPRAVGKTTTARLLAKAVNCETRKDGESEPCNTCETCLRIMDGRDFDVVEIDAASNTGVDNVRDNIIANTRVAPSKNRFKIFIIDEVHMLSTSAFNALLKTLEEPPKNIIFILATTEIHKVPQTIISRCQRFDFKRLSNQEMVGRLSYIVKAEGKQVEDGVLENVARHSGGYVRDAETLLGQILGMDEKIISLEQSEIVIPSSHFNLVVDFIETLVDKNIAKAIGQLNNLVEESVDLVQFSKDLVEVLRKMLLLKMADDLDKFALDLDQKNEDRIFIMKTKVEENFLTRALTIFVEKSKDLSSSSIIQLPLELAVIELISSASVQTDLPAQIITKKKVQADGKKEGLNFNFESTKQAPVQKVSTGAVEAVSNLDIELSDVLKSWSEVLVEVRKKEAAMSFMLGAAIPVRLEGNTLEIGFKHNFHCETMKNSDKIERLEQIVKGILNVDLRITCLTDLTIELDPVKIAPQITEQSDNLQNIGGEQDENLKGLLDMFGGKVVE